MQNCLCSFCVAVFFVSCFEFVLHRCVLARPCVFGHTVFLICWPSQASNTTQRKSISISGLVVEYIVAIDVTRVRFPADALLVLHRAVRCWRRLWQRSSWLARCAICVYMRVFARFVHLCVGHTAGKGPQPGTWCSGITSASHAEGPGFNPQCVHYLLPWSWLMGRLR